MIEIQGNFWDYVKNYDAVCITTNGIVKNNGRLVMGKGLAGEARDLYPELDIRFGRLVKIHGNRVLYARLDNINFVSYPTKNHYRDKSDIHLIVKSAYEVVEFADYRGWGKILLTRPGCSNGWLTWSYVKQYIEDILDDRFFVIEKT